MGVLFLMWNVPYAVALWHPVRHRVSLYEAVAMQTIGLIGESLILWSLGGAHPVAAGSVTRSSPLMAPGWCYWRWRPGLRDASDDVLGRIHRTASSRTCHLTTSGR